MPSLSPSDLAPFLEGAFASHGASTQRDGHYVLVGSQQLRVWGNIALEIENPSHWVIQLDVFIEIGPGRTMIESSAGFGPTLQDAIHSAQMAFLHNSLHVILSAFCSEPCPETEIETWVFPNQSFQAHIGRMISRGAAPAQGYPIEWFSLLESLLISTPLPQRTHWVRTYFCRSPSNTTLEVLINNNPDEKLQSSLSAFDWPTTDSFYSVRLFLILKPEFDVSQSLGCFYRYSHLPPTEIIHKLVALGAPAPLATKLYNLLPIAFGRALLKRMQISFSQQAIFVTDGAETPINLVDDPLFADASTLAEDYFNHGTITKDVFETVLLKSPEFQYVNDSLHQGIPKEQIVVPLLRINQPCYPAKHHALRR